MNEKQDYITKADGWVAGKWRAKGSPLSLTSTQAKYESVEPVIIGVDLAKGEDETVVAPLNYEKGRCIRVDARDWADRIP